MNVMMAIRRSGTFWPNIVSENTSLGFGQGSVVDMRTVMYEIRKELKMKVSLRRKIHIMALPQGTFLKARWSEDQSATMPCTPSGSAGDCMVSVDVAGVMCLGPVYLIPESFNKRSRLFPVNSRPKRTSHTPSRKCQ